LHEYFTESGDGMTNKDLRDSANRRFELKTDSQRRAAVAAQEREVASREVRAKTERLRALRLAKEAAETAPQPAVVAAEPEGEKT
jgi:hypothetical protein